MNQLLEAAVWWLPSRVLSSRSLTTLSMKEHTMASSSIGTLSKEKNTWVLILLCIPKSRASLYMTLARRSLPAKLSSLPANRPLKFWFSINLQSMASISISATLWQSLKTLRNKLLEYHSKLNILKTVLSSLTSVLWLNNGSKRPKFPKRKRKKRRRKMKRKETQLSLKGKRWNLNKRNLKSKR